MRILMITDFYYPYLGGVEQHVRTLTAELAAHGHQVSVATLGRAGLDNQDLDGAVRIYRLRGSAQRVPGLFANAGRPWAPPFPDPELVLGLRRVIHQERPQIVHGHDWLARSFLPLKRASRAQFVMSLHYYSLSCALKNLRRFDREPCPGPGLVCLPCSASHYGPVKGLPIAAGHLTWSALERASVDLFLPVSAATASGNGLISSGLPYQIIPNFLRDPVESAEDSRPFLDQLPTEPFFLFVGDLRRLKGIEVLLQAYALLQGRGVPVPPLVLIGKTWPETPANLPPNVFLFKDWPNFAVRAAWGRSLAAVVPSVWAEPFGIVVIEAMAAGKPVIASRTGGIPDLVAEGETGLLVPPGEAEPLCAAMQRLIQAPELTARMGEAAAVRSQDYQARTVVPRIERAYAELIRLPAPAAPPRERSDAVPQIPSE